MNITLEITPKVQEELVRQALVTGCGVEAHAASLLEEALHLAALEQSLSPAEHPEFGKSLVDVFAEARRLGLFADSDLDFGRDPSPGRTIELS